MVVAYAAVTTGCRVLWLVAAVAIAAAGSAAAFFGRHHRWHDDEFDGERVRYGVEWMLHGVDPTDAQVDAITAIAVDAPRGTTTQGHDHREPPHQTN